MQHVFNNYRINLIRLNSYLFLIISITIPSESKILAQNLWRNPISEDLKKHIFQE